LSETVWRFPGLDALILLDWVEDRYHQPHGSQCYSSVLTWRKLKFDIAVAIEMNARRIITIFILKLGGLG
jgi:hypothetical protein